MVTTTTLRFVKNIFNQGVFIHFMDRDKIDTDGRNGQHFSWTEWTCFEKRGAFPNDWENENALNDRVREKNNEIRVKNQAG